MRKWLVKFNQRFNGRISTCYVTVEGRTIRDALDEFHRIGYANTDVKSVKEMQRNERFSDGGGDAEKTDAKIYSFPR